MSINILQAIADPDLFAPFLGAPATWEPWFAALACLYGLPMPKRQRAIVRQCTQRLVGNMPAAGFDTALFLTGRRSGKSRVAALVGAFEAQFAGHEKKLSAGERGVVAICSPTREQSRIVHSYLRAIFDVPALRPEVIAETQTAFELANGVAIEIVTGDHKTVRGRTLLAAIVDEVAFFGYGEEARVKSDTELIRALQPGLATVGGKLIAISSPYARKGWTYRTWEKSFGKDAAKVLVWNAASRTMNSTLPQSVVDEAIAEDLQAAKSEYLGEFRDDVAEFLPKSLIQGLVVPGRKELLPRGTIAYHAFVDVSGGRSDDCALAIAHLGDGKAVVDLLRRWRPPCNPHVVIQEMCALLKQYGVRRVTGDNYSAEFTAAAFRAQGIAYVKSEKPKGQLYLELLPRLCSGEVELLDDPVLVNQLAGLERRTRSGGRDVVDHGPGGHDDMANVLAGVVVSASKRTIHVGPFGVGRQLPVDAVLNHRRALAVMAGHSLRGA